MGARKEAKFKALERERADKVTNSAEARSRQMMNTMAAQIERLRTDLSTTQAELARAKACVLRQRAALTVAHESLKEERTRTEEKHSEMMRWFRAFESKNRAWEKLSRMVWDLCSRQEVAEWRAANREKGDDEKAA